jgi:endonuclease/exonuclease/phosphatase family metal-dependent hydrolase
MALVALVASLAACTPEPDMGEPQPWVAVDAITGTMRPVIGIEPTPVRARGAVDGMIRVVTYNVEQGADVNGLAKAILGDEELAKADLIMVQEIEDHPHEGGSRASRLAAKLGMGFVYAPERQTRDGGTHGTAILSVFPLSNVQVMQLPRVDLPWSKAPRIALAADVDTGSRRFHVITMHLDTRMSIQQRILQIRPAVLDAPDHTLVGGDFNTNPFTWADGTIPQLPSNSVAGVDQAPMLDDYMQHIGYQTPTASSGPTNHTALIDTRLDSIFVKGLDVAPGQVEREIGLSDHWPLWVDLVD